MARPEARIERSALILLAAGLSRRFGTADKLAADLHGKPLAMHAADRLGTLPFARRIVVVSGTALPFPGWTRIDNPDPAAGQGRSLALGIAAAAAGGADAAVVALADMPFIAADHVQALFAALDHRGAVGTQGPGGAMPPALFTDQHFGALTALTGDRGARGLLTDMPLVAADFDTLIDVDTPERLAMMQRRR
ncbi:NTP transferase domain-containing protein [Sphingomonas sp. CJ99]